MKKLLLTAILSSSLIMETTFADDRYILKDDNKNTINSNSKDNNQKDINKPKQTATTTTTTIQAKPVESYYVGKINDCYLYKVGEFYQCKGEQR